MSIRRWVRWPDARAVALFAALYLACNQLAYLLEVESAGLAGFWPASGVAAVAVAGARGRRLAALLAVVLVVNAAVNVGQGRPLLVALGIGVANLIETGALASLLRLWRVRTPFHEVRDLLRFCAAVGAATGLGAVTAGVVLSSELGMAPLKVGATWLLGDAVGMLVVAPVLLMPAGWWTSSGRRWSRLEPLAAAGFVLGVSAAAFGQREALPLTFLGVPPLVWSALRLRPRTTALIAAVAGSRSVR